MLGGDFLAARQRAAMAQIRHLAIFTENPQELAEFYRDVFGMEIIGGTGVFGDVWVSDGHIDVALLKHREGVNLGLNHIGITMAEEEKAAVYARLAERGITPKSPGPGRVFAEDAAHDIHGNRMDLTTATRRNLVVHPS
jgi:catechol 2,3-dioxygenase-like lactoylglutathione lyase family enzyme